MIFIELLYLMIYESLKTNEIEALAFKKLYTNETIKTKKSNFNNIF